MQDPTDYHELLFIDQSTYYGLKESGHAFSPEHFKLLFHKDPQMLAHLSEASVKHLECVDASIKYALFGRECSYLQAPRTTAERYTTEQVHHLLTHMPQGDQPEGGAVFYEIAPIDNQSHLIVVAAGFLYHLTQSKDNLIGFVLACLSALDRLDCKSLQLNELYLRLKCISNYELLIANRASV